MTRHTTRRQPWWRRLWPWCLALLVLALGAGGLWLSHTYPAHEGARSSYDADPYHQEGQAEIIFQPHTSNGQAIIFYPGAQVDPVAYTPLLQGLQAEGFTVVLVKMPLNLAVLDGKAADRYLGQLAGIDRYYLMGHSMGGAMASAYASQHVDQVAGLILLGAYPYKDFPSERTLIIYGSLNTSVADKVKTTVNVVVLPGGNHAQFGDYGPQLGDAVATLSAQDQQSQTLAAIRRFILAQSSD